MAEIVKKLPKNPKKGDIYSMIVNKKRKITFKATGKSGFGKWKITANEKA